MEVALILSDPNSLATDADIGLTTNVTCTGQAVQFAANKFKHLNRKNSDK